MRKIVAFILLVMAAVSATPQPSDCASEASLQGRSDILHCEGWESSTWWQNGYMDDGEKTSPSPASGPDQSSVVSTGCISGSCLKVRCRAYNDGGCGGALAHHWPIPGGQTEVWLRYYLKLSPNWSPENYDSSGVNVDNGGKFPGLADVRTNADPSGQCGNGGAYSDGINCWSGRLKYRNCTGSGGADICTAGGTETTRLGWYWYLPPNTSATNQEFGPFDNQSWGTTNATCSSSSSNLGSTGSDSTSCGKGAAGLVNDVWYRVEIHIRMNTAGVANGVAEAWITKAGDSTTTLKYRKTNVLFRESGHDSLHIRTVWLDIHMGGEGVGPLEESYVMLDQMVVATGGRVGGFRSSGAFNSSPFNVNVN